MAGGRAFCGSGELSSRVQVSSKNDGSGRVLQKGEILSFGGCQCGLIMIVCLGRRRHVDYI